jgi:hypothetical protein
LNPERFLNQDREDKANDSKIVDLFNGNQVPRDYIVVNAYFFKGSLEASVVMDLDSIKRVNYKEFDIDRKIAKENRIGKTEFDKLLDNIKDPGDYEMDGRILEKIKHSSC